MTRNKGMTLNSRDRRRDTITDDAHLAGDIIAATSPIYSPFGNIVAKETVMVQM